MKPFKKRMACLVFAAATAIGIQTVAAAAEDIPPEGEAQQQPQSYSAPATPRPKSIEDYQADNDEAGVKKSRIEQSPALHYDGNVGGVADGAAIPLDEIDGAEDVDAAQANSTLNDVRTVATEEAVTTAEEEAAPINADDDEDQDHPDTGRGAAALPIAGAAVLLAAGLPALKRKAK